jgi:uncharacterized protein YkwD
VRRPGRRTLCGRVAQRVSNPTRTRPRRRPPPTGLRTAAPAARVPARIAALAAVLGWVGCTLLSPGRKPDILVVRAPDLEPPLTETYPAPSEPAGDVQIAVWRQINADRAQAGLPGVAWDEAAARVAGVFCRAQIREGTSGHFLTNGLPPYTRTAFAGIFGVEQENAVSWTTTGEAFEDAPVDLALAGQASMMAEKPPNDGHRRTILDPDVTHVGVGWAEAHGAFRMAEEFLTRRLESLTLGLVTRSPDTVLVQGRTRDPYLPVFVTFAHEPTPPNLTKAQAIARRSYAYPEAGLSYVPEGDRSMRVVGTETEDRLHVGKSGEFSFRFRPARPGLWTVLVYTARGRESPRPGGLFVLSVAKAGPR